MQLLLISNSTMAGDDYFAFPQPFINEFLENKPRNILFIPFAGVSFSYDEYEEKVQKQLATFGHKLVSIHHFDNYKEAIEKAEVIMIGGGNTWHLTHMLHKFNLIEPIQKQVVKNNIPYIGWSAGSNVACPTIMTTNDMPIIDPLGLDALNLVPFQINAHYTDLTISGHGGETRAMRLNEFIIANPDIYVIGLMEGSMIEVRDSKYILKGLEKPVCKIFKYGQEVVETNNLSLF